MTAPDPATILTRRFGYGPAGAQPRDAGGLLAGLAGADLMAARHPAPTIAEAAGRPPRRTNVRSGCGPGFL
jgi:hypothetical protein